MSILNQNKKSIIGRGNENDICYACAIEIEADTQEEKYKKLQKLKRQLNNKTIIKINVHDDFICICPKHIKEAYKAIIKEEDTFKKIYGNHKNGKSDSND